MGTAVGKLIDMMFEGDPYGHSRDELVPLQVAAIDERLQERRGQIRVLDQRATETGMGSVTSLDDAIPLLFAHSTYKSYPEAFVTQRRWDRMCQWLATLSTRPIDDVDLEGVTDVDEWIQRLHDAGHLVIATSGTTGKCSFFYQTAGDREIGISASIQGFSWACGFEPAGDRPVFLLGPSRGAHRFIEVFTALGEAFGRSGQVHFLSDTPVSAAEANRLGSLRKAIGEGRATPGEIADAEKFTAQRQKEMAESFRVLVDVIVAHREEPALLAGFWQQHWLIMQAARARGVGDGEFHADTLVMVGGGRKSAAMPNDYEDQIRRFYGLAPTRFLNGYGMAELSGILPSCSEGRYHCPPGVVLLVVDKAAERLLNPPLGEDGTVEGRAAFFDVTIEGRWGGLITGDNITADFSSCPCGRPGPTITRVVRYTDLAEGEDKLTCAGTIDSYVHGFLEEATFSQ